MTEPSSTPQKPRSATAQWTWIVATSLFVIIAFGAPFALQQAEEHLPAVLADHPAQTNQGPKMVADGDHYYVLLAVIEVAPKADDEDSSWDPRDSAPDIRYAIHWQGHRVFESSTKDDTLLAKWSNTAVELTDLLESVSLDDSFKAARVTARSGESIRFEVEDVDPLRNDPIGEWSVEFDRLRLGDQVWENPGGRVVKAICRVLPLDQVAFEELTR